MGLRNSFDRALSLLQQDILRVASLVEQAIDDAVHALMRQNATLAAQVIMGDEMIDELCREVEDKCVKLIATQHPIGRDLRAVITGIKILNSLERMADHAVDIARATMCLSGFPLNVKPMEYIPQMAAIAQQMVRDGLDAYVNNDVVKARRMCELDDDVDFIFAQVFKDLQQCMRQEPETVMQGAYLLYVSKYIERIADHATNVGEAVIYLVTGERNSLN